MRGRFTVAKLTLANTRCPKPRHFPGRAGANLRVGYALGFPDLLIFSRRCFFPALRTFLAPRVFFFS